jgi:hypothetical protein
MKKIPEELEAVSLEEAEDIVIGQRGTPRRDDYEARVAATVMGSTHETEEIVR